MQKKKECAGINCYIKQQLCIKHKVKRQFVGKGQRKKALFCDLSKYGVASVQTPAHSATTIPKPSMNFDYDSDTAAYEENMAIFWESQETNSEEFGFSGNVVEMSTTRPWLTRKPFQKPPFYIKLLI